MAWVKQNGVREWREGVPYTGAITAMGLYHWNCPEEKDCPDRFEIHAFFICIAKLNQPVKGKNVQVFSCGHWHRREAKCKLEKNPKPSELASGSGKSRSKEEEVSG